MEKTPGARNIGVARCVCGKSLGRQRNRGLLRGAADDAAARATRGSLFQARVHQAADTWTAARWIRCGAAKRATVAAGAIVAEQATIAVRRATSAAVARGGWSATRARSRGRRLRCAVGTTATVARCVRNGRWHRRGRRVRVRGSRGGCIRIRLAGSASANRADDEHGNETQHTPRIASLLRVA